MGDSQEMVREYLELAAGFETRAEHALDRKLSDELRRAAEQYRRLAAEAQSPVTGQ
jgi:hypothetical protein